MRFASILRLALLWVAPCACRAQRPIGPAPASLQPRSTPGVVRVDTIAKGLSHPWGLEFLPDGRMIVTERDGRVRIVTLQGKVLPPLKNVPMVQAQGQGGLLDVALDPGFAQNRTIYLSYAEPGDDNTAGTAVARAKLSGDTALIGVRVIYQQQPKKRGGGHFGSRIVFQDSNTIFVTQGERFNYRDEAQDQKSLLGKIVRVHTDGSIPRDNPFVGRSDARAEIWSSGHRNMQGAALDSTGRLWTIEHGPAGGDELNHPEPGKNYGWPVIGYGVNYDGSRVGIGAVKDGIEQPVIYWDPVIAPSGMAIYYGDRYGADWRGNIFVGSMNPGALVRLVMSPAGTVAREERYLGELNARIRDVKQGPDGFLYVITDEGDGRIYRVVPAR